MNKNQLKKLAAYSVVAASVIAIPSNSNVSIIGYDLTQGSVLTLPNDTGVFEVNINNTGEHCDDITDFTFKFDMDGTTSYLRIKGNDNSIYAIPNIYTYTSYSFHTYEYLTGLYTYFYCPYTTARTYTWWTVKVLESTSSLGPSNNVDSFNSTATLGLAYSNDATWGARVNESEKYLGL